MDRVQVLVLEDNALHAAKVEMILDNLGYQMVGMVDNALDAMDKLQNEPVDLILLDINISGSFSGIDFAQRVRKTSQVPIIYISSMRDKEVFEEAKLTHPDAFVYKPIDEEALCAAIELAVDRSHAIIGDANSNTTEQKNVLDEVVFLKVGNALKKVVLREIVYINVSAKNYCDIRTTQKSYSIKSSLNELSSVLNTDMFLRVSRSHILNLSFIVEINERDAYIDTGFEPVPLGKGFKASLYDKLKKI